MKKTASKRPIRKKTWKDTWKRNLKRQHRKDNAKRRFGKDIGIKIDNIIFFTLFANKLIKSSI